MEKVLSDQQADTVYNVDMLEKGAIHIPDMRFHYATQNSMQFKTYFPFTIFGLQLTE